MRGVVLPWLLKLILALGLLGFLALEGAAVIAAHVDADGDARNLALEAATLWPAHPDPEAVRQALEPLASASQVAIVDLVTEGTSVRVTVEKRARTHLLHRLGFLAPLTRARATAAAPIR